MTTPETVACILLFVCLVAALFRAPLVALPLAPPCLLTLAALFGLVDLSSASHPLRWLVPSVSMTLALGVMWYARRNLAWRNRTLYASLLVFASSGPDVLALLAWRLPGPWILVPFQTGVCLAVLGVLFVPERWLARD